MSKVIGKVAATEKAPTTIDEFNFWTQKDIILSPFDVVKVNHIGLNKGESVTFGVIEEISHITDSAGYLSSFISNDFGDTSYHPPMDRIGLNFVKCKVLNNTENIYTPVQDGSSVSLSSSEEVLEALGLKDVKNPLAGGYLEMYSGDENKITIPVNFNSQFLLGPEGAHLNISGISGLGSKTSYNMFLMKAIQQQAIANMKEGGSGEKIAFVLFNVKGKDLLAIEEANPKLPDHDRGIYEMLGIEPTPFENVKYFYPYDQGGNEIASFCPKSRYDSQKERGIAYKYKYIYEYDRENLDLLFSNVEDSTGTMESIINYILTNQGNFGGITSWDSFLQEVDNHCNTKSTGGRTTEITVSSWRKFKRVVNKTLKNPLFANRAVPEKKELRVADAVDSIKENDMFVFDIAKLDLDMQAFVFGDVITRIYDLMLGQTERDEDQIPDKILIFVDELNKYASNDVPKSSPILKQLIDITERGRSLGIILFSAEQFRSAIHDRVKGNCATHAYGRTNSIEISKADYRFVPNVYKNMMTRLKQGEYIIQNPVFRSLLKIKFPHPVYHQL